MKFTNGVFAAPGTFPEVTPRKGVRPRKGPRKGVRQRCQEPIHPFLIRDFPEARAILSN